MTIYLTPLSDDLTLFPKVSSALESPDGLLAIGGDLKPLRILNAYRNGIFPWFSAGEPLLWWSPSERAILTAGKAHISKSMKRFINKQSMAITINHAFSSVIEACAKPRASQAETWISQEMINAYTELHQLGFAHSIEVWHEETLVGGLYGICIGKTFCGESMFSQMANSSKLAFIALNQHFSAAGGELIDCQMQTEHLQSLGVEKCSRSAFIGMLEKTKDQRLKEGCWDKQPIEIELL
jgi:leucyl/phenylalanyl-tRNA--protein transferase